MDEGGLLLVSDDDEAPSVGAALALDVGVSLVDSPPRLAAAQANTVRPQHPQNGEFAQSESCLCNLCVLSGI